MGLEGARLRVRHEVQQPLCSHEVHPLQAAEILGGSTARGTVHLRPGLLRAITDARTGMAVPMTGSVRQRGREGKVKSRKILALAVLAAVASVVAAYAASSTSARPEQAKSIAFVPPVIANPIIKALNDAIKLKAESLGMKFTTVGGEYNPQAQIVAVDSVVQRGYDALLIWPLDPKGIQPSFDKARKAGIPIVVIESPKAGPYLANFSQQSLQAAVAIGTYGANAAKKKFGSCSVGIIQGIPVVDVLRNRNVGLEAAAKKAGCTILDKQVNQKDNTDGARPIVDGWKTKFGSKMNLILAYNDPSALGAVSAVGGDFNPLITGENGDSLAVEAVKNHTMLAT